MTRDYESKHAYFRISNNIVFLELKDEAVLDIEAVKAITSDRLRLQGDKSFPVLFNMEGVSDSNKSGRDYLAKYGWILAERVGIFACSAIALQIAAFYLRFGKPNVITKIFKDKQEALIFLEKPH